MWMSSQGRLFVIDLRAGGDNEADITFLGHLSIHVRVHVAHVHPSFVNSTALCFWRVAKATGGTLSADCDAVLNNQASRGRDAVGNEKTAVDGGKHASKLNVKSM